jgi:DNA (cytosine-5)-methyltransferase 1
MVINVVDVFAGCGGLSYGFQKAGFNIILGVDNDKDCAETFSRNHAGSQYLHMDIRDVSEELIKRKLGQKEIAVLIGGPPCQGFSLSGKRVFMDPRNSLYLHFFNILDILAPKIAIIENVPGIKGLYGGEAFVSILKEFEKRGYSVSHKLLKADDYGVPQTRKRMFIVGSKYGKFEFPKPLQKKITLGEAVSDLPLLEDTNESCNEYICPPQNEYQKLMREKSARIHNHVTTNHTSQTKRIIRMVPEGKNYKSLPKELQNTRNVHIAWTRLDSSKPSLTIDTGHRHHFHPKANRVPTVRECARIQSFPDNFIFFGSKTSQYRQVGNAVPPLLAFAVAKEIKRYLKYGPVQNS